MSGSPTVIAKHGARSGREAADRQTPHLAASGERQPESAESWKLFVGE